MVTLHIVQDYDLDEDALQDIVESTVNTHSTSSDVELTVAVIPHEDVVQMAIEHMKESREEAEDHPVLSYPTAEVEGPFVFPPDGISHIGEVFVSYEKAHEYADEKGTTVQKEIEELAEHGVLHLLGIHHD